MIFFTGDIHGDVSPITSFYKRMRPASDDILVLLGDVGINYFGNKTDKKKKGWLIAHGLESYCPQAWIDAFSPKERTNVQFPSL